MKLEELLAMMGVSSAADAAAAITRMNLFLEELKTKSGTASVGEALDVMRDRMRALDAIEAAAGAQGTAALARVEAWRQSADRVTELEARATATEQQLKDRDAQTLLDAAGEEGRLLPAHRERAQQFYQSHGIDALREYLAALPVMAHAPGTRDVRQPQSPNPEQRTATSLSAEERKIAKLMGISEAEMAAGLSTWEQHKGVIDEQHTNALNKTITKVGTQAA